MLIYKILRPSEWQQFEIDGRFEGSPDDRRDGFIHCSSRVQVGATALRHFADQAELIVLALDADTIESVLQWEPSSSGELFPHVYAPLPRKSVVQVHHVSGAAAVDDVLGTN